MCWVSYTCKNLTQVHGNFTNLCVTVSATWSTLNKWEWICDTHIYIIYIYIRASYNYINLHFDWLCWGKPRSRRRCRFCRCQPWHRPPDSEALPSPTDPWFLSPLAPSSPSLSAGRSLSASTQTNQWVTSLSCHKVTESVRMKCIWTIFNITLKHSEQWNSDVSLVILLLVSHLKEIQTHNRFK